MRRGIAAGLCAALAAPGIAASSAVQGSAVQGVDPGRVYAAHAAELAEPGVRAFDGFTFSTAVVAGDLKGPLSAPAALRAMLQVRLQATFGGSDLQAAVGRAAAFAGVGCVEGRVDITGMQRVAEDRLPGGKVRAVHAIPSPRIEAVSLRMPELLTCLDGRLTAGKASVAEVLLLGELVPAEQVPGALVRSLSAVCGDGWSATSRRAWVGDGGAPLANGIEGWRTAVREAVRADGGSFNGALRPLSGKELESIVDPEEAIRRIGRRANDPALLARAADLLGSLRWTRCASQLPTAVAEIVPAVDRAGSRLPQSLRAEVASGRIVTLLLLTNGECPLVFADRPGPNEQAARAKYNEASSEAPPDASREALTEAVRLLRDDFEAAPTIEGGVLLSASLLALQDPGLAFPVARATFRAAPRHPFAGVFALISLRRLGLPEAAAKGAAARLLPEVERSAQLEQWGRAQLEEIRVWCGLGPRPAVPSGQVPKQPSPQQDQDDP